MEDLVRRESVTKWIERWEGYLDGDMIGRMQSRVRDIPSACVPNRSFGKWIRKEKLREDLDVDSDYIYSCSECGCSDVHNELVTVPFCWHCGAMMGE